MDPWTYYAVAALAVIVAFGCWFSNLIGAPGNWLVVGLALLMAIFVSAPDRGIGGRTVWILGGLAVVGEILEFAAGAAGAAKQGASRRAMLFSLAGAMVGSIGGAIVGAPIPVIGSIVAALFGGAGGAFVGAYLGESQSERPHAERLAVGKAAFKGRLLGTLGKLAVGAAMVGVFSVDAFWN